jgi:hypothetical protein
LFSTDGDFFLSWIFQQTIRKMKLVKVSVSFIGILEDSIVSHALHLGFIFIELKDEECIVWIIEVDGCINDAWIEVGGRVASPPAVFHLHMKAYERCGPLSVNGCDRRACHCWIYGDGWLIVERSESARIFVIFGHKIKVSAKLLCCLGIQ